MIELSGATNKLVSLALDACALRHQAIAHNIANVNTPGYVPLKADFAEQLSGVMSASRARPDAGLARPLEARAHLAVDIERQVDDPRVALEMEMVKLAQNTVHYQALLKGQGKSTAIISLAINEGRR